MSWDCLGVYRNCCLCQECNVFMRCEYGLRCCALDLTLNPNRKRGTHELILSSEVDSASEVACKLTAQLPLINATPVTFEGKWLN